jgi:hypothetical protein
LNIRRQSARWARVDSKTKLTVTAKNNKEATIVTTGKVIIMGKETDVPAQKLKIDLTKPYDPTSEAKLPKGVAVKVEKGAGTEKIMVGGKEYECTWVKFKTGKKNNETETTVWTSKDVPLSGIVKREVKSSVGDTTTMELISFGSK